MRVLWTHKRFSIAIIMAATLNALLGSVGIMALLPIAKYAMDGHLEGTLGTRLQPLLNALDFMPPFAALCAGFLALMFLKFIVGTVNSAIGTVYAWTLRRKWSAALFDKYLNASISHIDGRRKGELIAGMMSEVQRSAICVQKTLVALSDIIMLLALYAASLAIDSKLTLTVSFLATLGVGGMMWLIRKTAARKGRERIKAIGDANSILSETLEALRQVKIFNLENRFAKLFNRKITDLGKLEIKLYLLRDLPSKTAEFLLACIMTIVLLVVFVTSDGNIKDSLPALMTLGFLGARLFQSAMKTAGTATQISAMAPALELVLGMLERKIPQEDLNSGEPLRKIEDDIVLRGVSFAYDEDSPVFRNLDMAIPTLKTTAITGSSGSGKTTIANLLSGFEKPLSGEIIVNGENIANWKLADLRRRVGYISQTPLLFNTTIRENIEMVTLDGALPESELEKLTNLAHVAEFAETLPGKYDTMVGERGEKLSGGQRQRVAIARALARDPDLLIFDEATNALDPESEAKIKDTITALKGEKTIVIIAHRSTLTGLADVAYDLDELKLEANGND